VPESEESIRYLAEHDAGPLISDGGPHLIQEVTRTVHVFQEVATTDQSWRTLKGLRRVHVPDEGDPIHGRLVNSGRIVAWIKTETITAAPLAQEPQEMPVSTANLDHVPTVQVVALDEVRNQCLSVVLESWRKSQ
jgi:hypothetical protein